MNILHLRLHSGLVYNPNLLQSLYHPNYYVLQQQCWTDDRCTKQHLMADLYICSNQSNTKHNILVNSTLFAKSVFLEKFIQITRKYIIVETNLTSNKYQDLYSSFLSIFRVKTLCQDETKLYICTYTYLYNRKNSQWINIYCLYCVTAVVTMWIENGSTVVLIMIFSHQQVVYINKLQTSSPNQQERLHLSSRLQYLGHSLVIGGDFAET